MLLRSEEQARDMIVCDGKDLNRAHKWPDYAKQKSSNVSCK